MIIVLNGYPGVGKLTIGRALTDILNGRLLDIHTVYNLAFALTEFKTPEFKATVEQVEAIAHDLIHRLDKDVPVVLTTVLAGDDAWAHAEWERMLELGRARPPFCVVHVACDLEENIERIQSAERDLKRKPRDPTYVRRNHEQAKMLAGSDEDILLKLDVTSLSAMEAAQTIADWARLM